MPLFELSLHFTPSFHRSCSVRIVGDLTGAASLEAQPAGLLPRLVFELRVDAARMETLHATCSNMLANWEQQWSAGGLDGIVIDGVFDSPDSAPREFTLWSPHAPSAAHAMLAAALDCLPPEHCSGLAEELLENVRSYLDLQPPVTVVRETTLRFRLAPWAHRSDAKAIEEVLLALPEEVELLVDASGVEHFGHVMNAILPMARLLKRPGAVRWVVRSDDAQALIAYGIEPSKIEHVQRASLSADGHPIVLGGLVISSLELIVLARDGARIALVRAIRQEYKEYQLTLEMAAAAAGELLDILAAHSLPAP